MSFYDEMATTAAEILEEFGSTGQLNITTNGEYDPSTGSAEQTFVSVTVTAAVFAYPERLINGTTVLQGDQIAYLSAIGLTMPKAGDVMAWQGVDYQVISVKPLAPAGTNVLCELQLRK